MGCIVSSTNYLINKLDELRVQYKRYPDNESELSNMQEIKAEYGLLFERLKAGNKLILYIW